MYTKRYGILMILAIHIPEIDFSQIINYLMSEIFRDVDINFNFFPIL